MDSYKAFQYVLISIVVNGSGRGALIDVQDYINNYCKSGYRLHSIDYSALSVNTIYLTFERMEDIRI